MLKNSCSLITILAACKRTGFESSHIHMMAFQFLYLDDIGSVFQQWTSQVEDFPQEIILGQMQIHS